MAFQFQVLITVMLLLILDMVPGTTKLFCNYLQSPITFNFVQISEPTF